MGYTGSEKCQRGLRLLIFQFFPRLRLFHGLRLLNLKKFPMPTFIKGPTFIRYLRVVWKIEQNREYGTIE